jgi:hypothetical protein
MSSAAAANVAFMRRQEIALATDALLARDLPHAKSLARAFERDLSPTSQKVTEPRVSGGVEVKILAPQFGAHEIDGSDVQKSGAEMSAIPPTAFDSAGRLNVCFGVTATVG